MKKPLWNNAFYKQLRKAALLSGIMACTGLPAQASWIDSDFYCRVYGCVVAHDGFTFDVYDNYVFATGGTVPVGGQMIPWSGNPFDGAGGVNPVITGTRTEGFYTVPLQDQGVILGIDTDGDGIADRLTRDDNGNGFLDAGDSMSAFELTSATDLVAPTTSAQRSFFLSSRTDFYVTAEARLVGTGDSLNTPAQLANIGFDYNVSRSGVNDGIRYGNDARNGNYIRELGNVDDLGDIFGAPVRILEFRNDIRRRDSNDLHTQSVRLDYVYGFEDYDLSMGEGHLRYEIEFDFYNR